MENAEKLRVVVELTEEINGIMRNLQTLAIGGALPEDWDGYELRQIATDLISERLAGRMTVQRHERYERDRAQYGLF